MKNNNYFIPNAMVHIEVGNKNFVYNWDVGNYIEFDEENSFLESLKRKKNIYISDSEDDALFLLENNYIFSSKKKYQSWKRNVLQEEESKISKSINLILLPAEQGCNFSCVYCYEDHSVKRKMGSDEKQALLNYIIKECNSREVKYVNVSYFGGEPLMNKKFIYEFNEEVQDLSDKFQFSFSSSMTTNGYLLDLKTATDFEELSIRSYQITLDGLKAEHDKLRPLIKGTGTYERIVKNLLEIRSSNLHVLIDIRVNFNDSHSADIYRDNLLSQLNDMFGGDSRFRVRFRPIGDYASLNNRNIDNSALCGKESANESQLDFEKFAIEKGIPLADINMFSGVGSYSCYAGKKNHFIIDSFLKIKKCTVALDSDINNVGQLSLDGSAVLNENHKKWIGSYNNKNCSSCSINTQCNSSACPLLNIKNNTAICPPVALFKDEWAERLVNFIQE